MKPKAYLNGKLFNPRTLKLETTNILVHNDMCIGIGYIPDDEEADQIELKGRIIVINQTTLIANTPDALTEAAGFHINIQTDKENTIAITTISEETSDSELDTLKSAAPTHIHFSSTYPQDKAIQLSNAYPRTHLISYPITWLLNPTNLLIESCLENNVTFLPSTEKELSFFTPLLFTQLWRELKAEEFFPLFQDRLKVFYGYAPAYPKLNKEIKFNTINIIDEQEIPLLNYIGIGHLYTE